MKYVFNNQPLVHTIKYKRVCCKLLCTSPLDKSIISFGRISRERKGKFERIDIIFHHLELNSYFMRYFNYYESDGDH